MSIRLSKVIDNYNLKEWIPEIDADEVKVTIIATGFEEQAKERVAVRTGSIWTTSPIERKAPREAIQKQSDNYITRSLRDTEEIVDPVEKSNTPVEDDDTPAFVRRQMEQNINKAN